MPIFKKTFSQWQNTLYEVLTNELKMNIIRKEEDPLKNEW